MLLLCNHDPYKSEKQAVKLPNSFFFTHYTKQYLNIDSITIVKVLDFMSLLTGRVILGQVLRIIACSSRSHTEMTASD